MSAAEKNKTSKSSVSSKKNRTYGFLAIVILIYFFQKFLGMVSFRFFLFMDNMLRLTSSIHPVVMWAVLGLFAGLIYGSFVAWKKYKLDFKLNLIPVSIFLLIVFILFMVNHPLDSATVNSAVQTIEPKENFIDTDSIRKFIVNKWKTVEVRGKKRENFIRAKNSVIAELDFRKNGKCYMNQNGNRKAFFYYTMAPDGKSLLFTNSAKTQETVPVQIISITKDELVITSKMYQNDTIILKVK